MGNVSMPWLTIWWLLLYYHCHHHCERHANPSSFFILVKCDFMLKEMLCLWQILWEFFCFSTFLFFDFPYSTFCIRLTSANNTHRVQSNIKEALDHIVHTNSGTTTMKVGRKMKREIQKNGKIMWRSQVATANEQAAEKYLNAFGIWIQN